MKKKISGESDINISKNMLLINGFEFTEDSYISAGPAKRSY
ncbi:hypothetical protein OIU77_026578 [Salix suchowensis]|uniref:Uncharacterized protein n=1 Tax=Salix suchowensis TaxID=1278906 RepID=A0ABQ9BPD4_9ROSI|nr:hypothetical protein OIU77_026578 [Salix suchowensis]